MPGKEGLRGGKVTVATHQRGPDIMARKNGIDLVVEASGGASSKPMQRDYPPFSSSQKRSHVAKALYTPARLFSENQRQKTCATSLLQVSKNPAPTSGNALIGPQACRLTALSTALHGRRRCFAINRNAWAHQLFLICEVPDRT